MSDSAGFAEDAGRALAEAATRAVRTGAAASAGADATGGGGEAAPDDGALDAASSSATEAGGMGRGCALTMFGTVAAGVTTTSRANPSR